MSIQATTDRFVLKNASNVTVTDTNRQEMIVTDTFTGTLSFPSYTAGTSAIVSLTQTTIGSCNSSANAVLGVAKLSTAGRVISYPIGGTRILASSFIPMDNDPLSLGYVTRALGVSVASMIEFLTFYVESGSLKYEFGIFVPRKGGTFTHPTFPAVTVDYNILCCKI